MSRVRQLPIWAQFVAGSLVIIVSMATAATAYALSILNETVPAPLPVPIDVPDVDPGEPETILLVGQDARPDEIAAGTYGRSDTAMLVRLDSDRDVIPLLSIPRDLIVDIPGHGTGMFNSAYSIGGPVLMLDTVRQLTGIDVNHVVNVNFRGFAKAVQAIGCVYVDVDQRYYHSNEGLAASAQYSEIDVRPGYQRLCGYKALEYVRYRHGDNDIVRSARQQDFLRETRARIPAEKLISDRHDLLKIFTDYTTSDINDAVTMLTVLKLVIDARDKPVKEVHFEGDVGDRVQASRSQIQNAVDQFLGVESTLTPIPAPAPIPEAPSSGPAPKTLPAVEHTAEGKTLAWRIRRRNRLMPIYYPATVAAGSEFAARPRAYNLQDHNLDDEETFSYKFTLRTPDDQYYGLQGTRWKDAPILDEPHETREMGDRTYNLYFDDDRLRMVSWENDDAVYWVSNSLLQTLSADEMIAIARGTRLFTPPQA